MTIVTGRLFYGLFYISVGIYLSSVTKKHNILFNLSLLIAGFSINYMFDGLIGKFSIILYSVSLFNIVSTIKLKDARVYPLLRNYSTTMYFIHLYIWTFYYKIMYGSKTYGLDCFAWTLIICILIAILYNIYLLWRKLKKKMLNQFLNSIFFSQLINFIISFIPFPESLQSIFYWCIRMKIKISN